MPLPEKLPQLRRLAWHDTPVAALEVAVSRRQFSLVIDCYEEARDDYSRTRVCFKGISNLEMNLLALAKGSRNDDLEVYALDVEPAGSGYCAAFRLLTGFGGPSAAISFYFEDVEVS